MFENISGCVRYIGGFVKTWNDFEDLVEEEGVQGVVETPGNQLEYRGPHKHHLKITMLSPYF